MVEWKKLCSLRIVLHITEKKIGDSNVIPLKDFVRLQKKK